jgi:immune inhibitor A
MPHRASSGITVHSHRMDDLCVVAPSPELKEKLISQFQRLRSRAADLVSRNISLRAPNRVGLNDGLIYPWTNFPLGTAAEVARRAALERAPLRGVIRVVVVLVDFSDKAMPAGAANRLMQLFFSTGELPNGSVKEYYTDVSDGLIDIEGQVVGPYRLPRTVAAYAGSDNGLQDGVPNAQTLANDAVTLANRDIDFTPYDNDGDGYVDAFIVVHAGRGAEETGSAADIWSHKWVLPSERVVDSAMIYAYLTIPEDAKLGVAAHELGHLLFGWPDLYDTDNTSEGIGNWCLMASGSWGLGGDRPVHPSAWCKATQGWINVVSQTSNADVTISDVKTGRTAYRLWKDGGGGNEYFLAENRQQAGFDTSLPGQGLLIWHIDDAISDNTNESHYKVALMQADGLRQLEANVNRGDDGDPFPGSTGNASFTESSTPSSRSYAGSNTFVAVTGVPTSSPEMQVHLSVTAMAPPPTDFQST